MRGTPTEISTADLDYGLGNILSQMNAGVFSSQSVSGLGGAADRAYFFPLIIPAPGVIERVWVMTGSTPTGNIDFGLFDSDGIIAVNRLASSGSVAQGTAHKRQKITTSIEVNNPCLLFFAVAAASSSATFYTSSIQSSRFAKMSACSQQNSALPLPSSHTKAAAGFQSVIWGGVSFRPV